MVTAPVPPAAAAGAWLPLTLCTWRAVAVPTPMAPEDRADARSSASRASHAESAAPTRRDGLNLGGLTTVLSTLAAGADGVAGTLAAAASPPTDRPRGGRGALLLAGVAGVCDPPGCGVAGARCPAAAPLVGVAAGRAAAGRAPTVEPLMLSPPPAPLVIGVDGADDEKRGGRAEGDVRPPRRCWEMGVNGVEGAAVGRPVADATLADVRDKAAAWRGGDGTLAPAPAAPALTRGGDEGGRPARGSGGCAPPWPASACSAAAAARWAARGEPLARGDACRGDRLSSAFPAATLRGEAFRPADPSPCERERATIPSRPITSPAATAAAAASWARSRAAGRPDPGRGGEGGMANAPPLRGAAATRRVLVGETDPRGWVRERARGEAVPCAEDDAPVAAAARRRGDSVRRPEPGERDGDEGDRHPSSAKTVVVPPTRAPRGCDAARRGDTAVLRGGDAGGGAACTVVAALAARADPTLCADAVVPEVKTRDVGLAGTTARGTGPGTTRASPSSTSSTGRSSPSSPSASAPPAAPPRSLRRSRSLAEAALPSPYGPRPTWG